MSRPDLQSRPCLAPYARLKTDPVSGDPVLLFPEGLLVLNSTAHEIVSRCDGEATIAELVQRLAEEFDAPKETLLDDVLENLEALRQRNLLVFAP